MESKKEFASFKIRRLKEGIEFNISLSPEMENELKLLNGEYEDELVFHNILNHKVIPLHGGRYSKIWQTESRFEDELIQILFIKGSSEPGGQTVVVKASRTFSQIKDLASRMENIYKKIYERIKPFSIEVRLVTCQ